ncbi:MAG: Hint domain-containing protein [Pseudomonadota bacterium]
MRRQDQDDVVLQRLLTRVEQGLSKRDETQPRVKPPEQPKYTWQLPGLAGNTRLSTDFGEVPASLIRTRDKVRCVDGRYLRVLRIQEYKLDQEFFDLHPHAKPVVIRKHSLGRQLPADTIEVSPAQHLVLPTDWNKRKTVRADATSTMRSECDRSTGMISYFSFDVGEATLLQGEGLWFSSYAS